MALALYQTRYGTAENFYPESPAFMSIIPHLCKHRPRIIQTLQQRYFKGDIAEPILPTIEAAVKQLEKMPRKFRWMSTQRLIERARTKNCIYSTEQLRRMDISKVLAAARTVDQSKFVARKIAVSSMVANRSDLPDIVREDLLMEDLGL
jgi:hypothetical protein